VPDDVQEVPIEEANWEESTNMLPLEPVIKVYSHVTSPNYVMPVRAASPIIALSCLWSSPPTTAHIDSGR
jgi:hypothetical protein